MGWRPGNTHQTRFALDHGVISRFACSAAGLTESRDAAIHEPRVIVHQLCRSQAVALERANPEVLKQHIGFACKCPDLILPLRGRNVDGD